MKIKNILFACVMAMPALLLSSCQTDEDEVFGESSSQRLQAYMDEVKSVLRSSEGGWVMDYYFGDNQSYGGTVITIKFDSLTCTAASELIPEETTSYYKMTYDQGAVLTFDTYNKVLHSLATPSSGNYEGYHADFEFTVQSATPELVVLKGKRIGNYAYLHPLKEPMLDYISKVGKMEDSIYVAQAVAKTGEDSVTASFDYANRYVTFTNSADSNFVEQRSFTYTDKGVRLYSDVNVDGHAVSDFVYNADGMQFIAQNAGANGFTMTGRMPAEYVDYADYEGTYWLHIVDTSNGDEKPDSMQISLVPGEVGKTYLMVGLNSNFDVTLNYDRGLGNLTWNTQIVAQDASGNDIWLNGASSALGGSLYVGNTNCGMVTTWNGDKEHPVYTWNTNSYEEMPTDSWCLWLAAPNVSESLGQYTSWPFANGANVLVYVSKMVKIN